MKKEVNKASGTRLSAILILFLLVVSIVALAGTPTAAFADKTYASFDTADEGGEKVLDAGSAHADDNAVFNDAYTAGDAQNIGGGTNVFKAVDGEEREILKAAVGADICKKYAHVSTYETIFGKILRFQQYLGGKIVEGAQLTVTVDKSGNILSKSGKYISVPHFSSQKISRDSAENIVYNVENCGVLACEDVYFYDGSDVYDVYKLTLENFKTYYISKQTGDVVCLLGSEGVAKTNMDAFGNALTIDVALENDIYILKDEQRKIYVANANGRSYENSPTISKTTFLNNLFASETGEDFDPIAVTVFDNLQKAYDFYTDEKNTGVSRYGITDKNNNGDQSDDYPLYVFLNYASNYPDSSANQNAFYSDSFSYGYICIGNGVSRRGQIYQQGKAADVIAHEYQHGVTDNIAGLNYINDSGALSEAFSDIFGALIEGGDPTDLNSSFWTIGENAIYNPWNETDMSLRSLKGGTSGQSYNIRNKYTCNIKDHLRSGHNEYCDYNGVHYNSTIITNVQYQLSLLKPQYFTRERIGTLWFTTLLQLTPTSTFLDFTNAFITSAITLGYSEELRNDVMLALTNVGLKSDIYKTVTFMNADDNSVLYMKILDNGVTSFDYSAVRSKIESEIITDECTMVFDELKNRDGSSFDLSTFENLTEDTVIFVAYDTYCTATFADADGNIISSTQYLKNSPVSPPADFSLDQNKFNFHGWRTQDMADTEYLDLSNFVILKNTTFVPTVTIKTYTLSLYSENSLIAELSIKYGNTISLSDKTFSDIIMDGYSVEGWYLDPQLTKKVDTLTITQNVTIYAKWQDTPYTLTRTAIITAAALAIAFIIFIPIIIFITKRRT